MTKHLFSLKDTGKIGVARSILKRHVRVLLLMFVALLGGGFDAGAEQRQTLVGGWDEIPPYSFIQTDRGISRWSGLDVELLHEIAKRAGYFIVSDQIVRLEHVKGLRTGKYDIAALATETPEREEFARFSIPYRSETMALILPKGHSAKLDAKDFTELIEIFKDTGFRLGVNPGVAFPSKALREYIADPDNQDVIVHLRPRQLVTSLLDGHIDGYLTNRILGSYFIDSMRASELVEEHPLMAHGDLHLMFSKASVPLDVVEKFNRAIESIHSDGTHRRLNEKYALPILVRLSLDNNWFKAVDIIGTIAFAISGLLLAFRYDYDVFGAVVLASLPAVGGGVVRDLITNRGELAVLASPIYIEIIAILVVGGYFALRLAVFMRRSAFGALAADQMERRRRQIGYAVQVCDAIGLAAFTVTGVVVALATQSSPLWIWGPTLAAITAAGGGILRDVVRSDPEIPVLKGELYPEIAVLWGFILSAYFMWEAHLLDAGDIRLGILITFLGAFATRMATIHLGLRSPRFSV